VDQYSTLFILAKPINPAEIEGQGATQHHVGYEQQSVHREFILAKIVGKLNHGCFDGGAQIAGLFFGLGKAPVSLEGGGMGFGNGQPTPEVL
jgi:hypothetical protein